MLSLNRQLIEGWVKDEELVFLGITGLEVASAYSRFETWLEEKKHAGMTFLENHKAIRRNPELLLPNARNAIVVGLPYAQLDNNNALPLVAQYARFQDYHSLLRERLQRIELKFKNVFPELGFRIAVDSAPLLEKALAEKTELGFLGKNSCYIHPKHGSFLLLGEILTTAELRFDDKTPVPLNQKSKDGGCGPCNLCQVNCPTGALNNDYSIDSSKCIAYWTIEHRGPIPTKFWPHLKQYYFGCDICQNVCPYNHPKKETLPPSIPIRKYPELFEVATMDQRKYELYFGGTPLTRAKRNGLRRNALIAMFVTADEKLPKAITLCESDEDETIQATVFEIKKASGFPLTPFCHDVKSKL